MAAAVLLLSLSLTPPLAAEPADAAIATRLEVVARTEITWTGEAGAVIGFSEAPRGLSSQDITLELLEGTFAVVGVGQRTQFCGGNDLCMRATAYFLPGQSVNPARLVPPIGGFEAIDYDLYLVSDGRARLRFDSDEHLPPGKVSVEASGEIDVVWEQLPSACANPPVCTIVYGGASHDVAAPGHVTSVARAAVPGGPDPQYEPHARGVAACRYPFIGSDRPEDPYQEPERGCNLIIDDPDVDDEQAMNNTIEIAGTAWANGGSTTVGAHNPKPDGRVYAGYVAQVHHGAIWNPSTTFALGLWFQGHVRLP